MICFTLFNSDLAMILVRHAKIADIKVILNKPIPEPSYIGKEEHGAGLDKKNTTLFRELVSRMPGTITF